MLKKIIKMLVLPGILLSLIITGCTINGGNEDLQNEDEEISASSDHSQPMKVLSNKRFLSLKQTYLHVETGYNGYIYCLASGYNEYINTSKGWGANHRLHVRKISGTTLYSPKFQYEFDSIWTYMHATSEYLIMYAKNNYDSNGKNFRLYSINSDGSISLKKTYKIQQNWDEIKIFYVYRDFSPGIDPRVPHVVFLKNDADVVNFKVFLLNYNELVFKRKLKLDGGFTSMAEADFDARYILLYKKFSSGNNFYKINIEYTSLASDTKAPIPLKRLPIYLSDIHGVLKHTEDPWEYLRDNPLYNYNFFYVKQGSAFGDTSHLKEYSNFKLDNHIRSYLTRDDDIGWDNITNNYRYLIVHRSSQLYKNKRNFMIALIE